jgi:hypothetical protein
MAAQGCRRKSNTSMKKESNGALPLRRRVRPQFVHDASGSVISANTSSVQQRHMAQRKSACETSSDYETMFHDPQRVKDAPFLDSRQAELVDTNFGDGAYNELNNDLAVDFAAFSITGRYGVPGDPIPMPTSNNVYGIGGGNAMTYADESDFIPDVPFMEDASLDNDFWLPTDTQEAGSSPMYHYASSPEFAILEDLSSVPPLAHFSQTGVPIIGGSHQYSYSMDTSRFVLSNNSQLQV